MLHGVTVFGVSMNIRHQFVVVVVVIIVVVVVVVVVVAVFLSLHYFASNSQSLTSLSCLKEVNKIYGKLI